MKLISTVIIFVLASTTLASQKQDQCYSLIFNFVKNNNKHSNIAKEDCSSFLSTTVSPCPLTKVQAITQTRTARASTTTSTATITRTSHKTQATGLTLVNTNTASATTIVPQTDYSTAYQTRVHTDTSYNTITNYATVTVTITTTFYFPLQTAPAPGPAPPPPRMVRNVAARKAPVVLQCKAQTWCAHKLPSYASLCKDEGAYSYACSCFGVGPATTTLRPSTVFKTTTQTKTITPIVTAHATITKGATKVDLRTITTTIKTTITKTRTITSTAVVVVTKFADPHITVTQTVSTRVTGTTTLTTAVPTYTPCPIVVASGPNVGQYLTCDSITYGGLVRFTSDPSLALQWSVGVGGVLDTGGNDLFGPAEDSGYMPVQGYAAIDTSSQYLVTCSVSDDLTVSCQTTHTNGNTNPINNMFCSGAKPLLIFCSESNKETFDVTTLKFQCPGGLQPVGSK